MVREMIRFFEDSGLHCEVTGTGIYDFPYRSKGRKKGRVGPFASIRPRRTGPQRGMPPRGRTFISRFREIAGGQPAASLPNETVWFDIERKERSEGTNDLADEIALFLRRYGIRFFRIKD